MIIQKYKIWEKNYRDQIKISYIFIDHKTYQLGLANLLFWNNYAWEYRISLDFPSNKSIIIPALYGFLKRCNNHLPKNTHNTSLGSFFGEFIPREPKFPEIVIPDIPVTIYESP